VIERLLDDVRRRARGADAIWRRVERTSVSFEWGRLKAAGVTEEAGIGLRVVRDGRVGTAGTTAVAGVEEGAQAAPLVERALASAALGEALELPFPEHAPLPDVPTHFARAADASLDDLIAIGRAVLERLAREGVQVNVAVERDISDTRVANTAGAAASYRSTAVGLSAEMWRVAGDDVLTIGDGWEGADLPGDDRVDALVRSISDRLERAVRIVQSPEGALPVVFTPAGLAAVLLPITQALSGKAVLQGISPLGDRIGERVFDPAFSLADDPLVPGRAASRPVDDECVPSTITRLVERGVVQRFIYDLETAARANMRSTGHGQRGIFSKPVPAYTNLVLGAGDKVSGEGTRELGGGLLADVRNGLLVDELIGVGQGNVIGGAFSHPVALAYRVERGEITGRVKDAAVAGNVYELLKKIGGFGKDRRWYGARHTPSLLLEGVSVARRSP
jgi:PmbA protein